MEENQIFSTMPSSVETMVCLLFTDPLLFIISLLVLYSFVYFIIYSEETNYRVTTFFSLARFVFSTINNI